MANPVRPDPRVQTIRVRVGRPQYSCGSRGWADEAERRAALAALDGLAAELANALILLRRYEYIGNGKHHALEGTGECPCCGWPKGGHDGPGRYKGNAENTHEEGCSLYAVLHGLPAPRLAALAAGSVAPPDGDTTVSARQDCGCARYCGDDGDHEGDGVCKGLLREPEPPLVEIVLVPRSAVAPPHGDTT